MNSPEKLNASTDCARIGLGTVGLCVTSIDPVQIADLITKYGGALLVLAGVAQLLFKVLGWLFKKEKK